MRRSEIPTTTPQPAAEAERIRVEYDRRARQPPPDLYGWNPSVRQFFYTQTFRGCVDALTREGMFPLHGKRVADIGCGMGNWLLDFVQVGCLSPYPRRH